MARKPAALDKIRIRRGAETAVDAEIIKINPLKSDPQTIHFRGRDRIVQNKGDENMMLVRVEKGKQAVGTWTKADGRIRRNVSQPAHLGEYETWDQTGEIDAYEERLIPVSAIV